MGFFSELEDSLERIIEGFFKEKFKGSLQPVDFAKRLAREMRLQRRAGLREVFVPNRYELYLNPEEYKAVQPVIERLSDELKEYIAGKTVENKYTVLGKIEVSFHEEQDIKADDLIVKSFFDETESPVEEEKPVSEATMQYIPIKGIFPQTPNEIKEAAARFKVLEGPFVGREYPVEGTLVVVGRKETCDIYLPDESVSRRHALVSRVGNQFYIKDQASTNGTYVNGSRVSQIELVHGDEVKIGRIIFGFKVE